MTTFGWFSGTEIKEAIESDKRYVGALTFARSYEPKEYHSYEWVLTHAQDEYARREKLLDALDSKADGLLRYLGAGTALLAYVVSLPEKTAIELWQFVPPMFFMVLALLFAARARSPEKVPQPLSSQSALRYADAYTQNRARASFAAMMGAASTGLLVAIAEKGELIRSAYWCFVAAIAWAAFVPLIVRLTTVFWS